MNFTKNKILCIASLFFINVYSSELSRIQKSKITNAYSLFKALYLTFHQNNKMLLIVDKMDEYSPIVDLDGKKIVNDYWLYVMHYSVLHACNDVAAYVLYVFDKVINPIEDELNMHLVASLVSFFSYDNECSDFKLDVKFGALLHAPFDYAFTYKYKTENTYFLKYSIDNETEKEEIKKVNRCKLFHFMKFLDFYKKYKIEDLLDASEKGPTGLPFDSLKSTPLQYAWMQDYLRISYDLNQKSNEKIKFFKSVDDFEESYTFKVIDTLKSHDISEKSMLKELRKFDNFSRDTPFFRKNSGSCKVFKMQEDFSDSVKQRLGIKITRV